METETGGGYTVRLAWRGRNDIGVGKEEDDDLLTLLYYFVFRRITAPITHPILYSYTHMASTEVGALWSILGVHLKKTNMHGNGNRGMYGAISMGRPK